MRLGMKLTQAELAGMLGISVRTLRDREHGISEVKPETLMAMEFVKVTVQKLRKKKRQNLPPRRRGQLEMVL